MLAKYKKTIKQISNHYNGRHQFCVRASSWVIAQFIALSLFSCHGGFQDQSLETTLLGNEGGLAQPSLPTRPSVSEWLQHNKPLMDGHVEGGQYDQKLVVEVLPEQQAIALILPLPPGFYQGQFLPSPLPGVEIVSPGSFKQTELKIIIPIRYLLRESKLGLYQKLPNGDPLPGMPAGETRGFSLSMREQSNHRIHVYFVASAVGVFVETPNLRYPEEIKSFLPSLNFPIRNTNRNQILGYLALVPDKNTYASGVFVSSRLPPKLAYELDQILRY